MALNNQFKQFVAQTAPQVTIPVVITSPQATDLPPALAVPPQATVIPGTTPKAPAASATASPTVPRSPKKKAKAPQAAAQPSPTSAPQANVLPSASVPKTKASTKQVDASKMEVENAPADDDDGFTLVVHKKKGIKRSLTAAEPGPASKEQKTDTSLPESQAIGSNQRRERRPPPITITDKRLWRELLSVLANNNIQYREAKNVRNGIRVVVASSDDHRAFTKLLDSRQIYYFTYPLDEEKRLRAVIRGVPKEIETSYILEDLKSKNLPAHEVHRMHSGITRTPYNAVLVVLDLSVAGKAIFNIDKVVGLSSIRVEPPNKTNILRQCHRCQLYGHAARFCHSRPRCVKCLGDHGTSECTRTRDCLDPPSCILCGQTGHPANYRGCPAAPRPRRNTTRAAKPSKKATFMPAPPPAINAWSEFPALPVPRSQPPMPTQTALQIPRSQPPMPTHTALPVAQAESSLEDMSRVMRFARSLPYDPVEFRLVSLKLEQATTQEEFDKITIAHSNLLKYFRDQPH